MARKLNTRFVFIATLVVGGVMFLAAGAMWYHKHHRDPKKLLETDSSYGQAHKHMGTLNRPAYLLDTAAVVAELRGISLDALGELETANALRLFSRMH